MNGCRQRLLFARQLIPRKCSLCSQGNDCQIQANFLLANKSCYFPKNIIAKLMLLFFKQKAKFFFWGVGGGTFYHYRCVVKIADSFHTITPMAINYHIKMFVLEIECSCKYSIKIWNGFYCQYFTKLILISTLKNSTFKLLEKSVKVHFEVLAFHNTLKLHSWQKLGFYSKKNLQIWCRLLLELTWNKATSVTSCK